MSARPKISWPATADELRAAGYRNRGRAACRSCGQEVTWAQTPAGRLVPLELLADPDSDVRRYQAHFASCVDAAVFRRRAAAKRATRR